MSWCPRRRGAEAQCDRDEAAYRLRRYRRSDPERTTSPLLDARISGPWQLVLYRSRVARALR